MLWTVALWKQSIEVRWSTLVLTKNECMKTIAFSHDKEHSSTCISPSLKPLCKYLAGDRDWEWDGLLGVFQNFCSQQNWPAHSHLKLGWRLRSRSRQIETVNFNHVNYCNTWSKWLNSTHHVEDDLPSHTDMYALHCCHYQVIAKSQNKCTKHRNCTLLW